MHLTTTTVATVTGRDVARRRREPILEVRGLVKHYPLTQGILFKKQVGAVKAVDGVDFDLGAGRDARHRGRVRLRQVDGGQDAGQPGEADGRRRSATRARTSPSCPGAP